MKKAAISAPVQFRLQGELALWRYGWRLPLAAVSLVLALLVCGLWLPAQYLALDAARQVLAQAEAGRGRAAEPVQAPPLQLFRDTLVMQDATPSQLRLIHQLASELGLRVAQLDMRRQQGAAGEFSQLQVSLPVKGRYLALKQFCGELLVQMPSVSIDQIIIKRDEAGGGDVEAQLSLSIWQQATAVEGAR